MTNKLLRTTIVGLLATLTGLIMAFPAYAADAHLGVSIGPSSMYLGATSSATVYVNSAGQSVNAFEGTISVTGSQLEIISSSDSGSICSIWIQNPTISADRNRISFSCGKPNPGFNGSNGTLFTFTIRGEQIGTGSAQFTSGKVLANDGSGTNVTGSFNSDSIEILAAPTPTITPTPEPSPTASPKPTQKPKPTPTPGTTIVQETEEEKERKVSNIGRKFVEISKNIPLIGDEIEIIAQKIIDVAQDSDTSVVAITTTVTLLSLPGLISLLSSLFATINYLSLWHLPLLFTGLIRKKRKSWGVVYDAINKQPLDPVVVKLTNITTGETHDTLTDFYGRYFFFVDPGDYKIEVFKSHYAFPSRFLKYKTADRAYDNLYFGDTVHIETENPVSLNIPMDPLGIDMNQEMKQLYLRPSLTSYLIPISSALFYVAFLWSFIAFAFVPHIGNGIIFGLFTLLFIFRRIHAKKRSWGQVKNTSGNPIHGARVTLHNKDIAEVKYPPVITKANGHYQFLVDKGTYFINVSIWNEDTHEYDFVYTSDEIQIHSSQGNIGKDITVNIDPNNSFLNMRLKKVLIMQILIFILLILLFIW